MDFNLRWKMVTISVMDMMEKIIVILLHVMELCTAFPRIGHLGHCLYMNL